MRFPRDARLSVILALTALLPACGGSGSTPTSPTSSTPPPGPQVTVVAQGSDQLAAGFVGTVPFTTSATGRLDATVNWTFTQNDLDIAVFAGACTATQILTLACGAPLGFAESLSRPEVLSLANRPAGAYTLAIENLGPDDESLSFQVTLTR